MKTKEILPLPIKSEKIKKIDNIPYFFGCL